MPKSKRNKSYVLANTRSKGFQLKENLLQEVRNAVDQYANVFVYRVVNMRNDKLKDVRAEWKHSRFFFGKNKVMQKALGKSDEDEYKDGLHHVAELLKGNVGLLFTNKSKQEVMDWFGTFSAEDFARSGFVASTKVELDEGPLADFPHSMEPQLRKLGLPTSLKKGVVTLLQNHTICQEGDVLSPEQATLLKLLDIKMADFKIELVAWWSKDGGHGVMNTGAEENRAGSEGDDDDDDDDDDV